LSTRNFDHLQNAKNLLKEIEEMTTWSKSSPDKVGAYARGIVTHLGKIYVKSEQSNWFGTIRKQIGNIDKLHFRKLPTKVKYLEHIHTGIDSNKPQLRTVIGLALQYKGHKLIGIEYVDFEQRVNYFFDVLAGYLANKFWNLEDNKDQIDHILDSVFLHKNPIRGL